ncbi:alpha/beta hydrolase [Kitasatospora mediocidica]|uniref:alpha/beta hydrolase n=1 Tax=Kitasatospora mediocidica TaxID=58352 RepID=UPI00055D8E1D|nr:alpha/beta fold hydrolase [Kitasatospora mediocidica]
MIDTKRPPEDVRREIVMLPHDGEELALHIWRPQEIKGAIFYFHGLQSHAGWLWEVGPQFADNGIALFVLDRRGSGISTGARSEIPGVETVIADYVTAIEHTRRTIGDGVPLSLFGHCLGGSFLAALLHHPDFTTRYDSAVFCSTWLGRLHALLGEEERAALAAEQSEELWDAGLKATDFTDNPGYQHFIDTDVLAVRELTRRSRATLLGLERLYLEPQRELPVVPYVFASGLTDPIVNLDATHRVFTEMVSGRGTIIKFPTAEHYLFYTEARRSVVDWASAFAILQDPDRHV